MILTDSKVTPLPYTYRSVYEHIEKCGRTCYHSLDQIKTGSAIPFVNRLISSQHYAMLEHASFAFEVDSDLYSYWKYIPGHKAVTVRESRCQVPIPFLALSKRSVSLAS